MAVAVALASLAMSFFFAIVIINGLLGNWLLNKARSEDSILGAVFFDGPSYEDYGYSSFSYRDSYLPLEAVGQAVDLAQKVVSEGLSGSSSLHSHNSKSKTKKRIQDHKMEMVRVEYTDEDGQTAYRMVRRRIQTRRPFLSKLVNWTKDVASFLAVGISMTGIGSFFWLVLTLPLWYVGVLFQVSNRGHLCLSFLTFPFLVSSCHAFGLWTSHTGPSIHSEMASFAHSEAQEIQEVVSHQSVQSLW